MSGINNTLWTEKYRPQTLNDYVWIDEAQRAQGKGSRIRRPRRIRGSHDQGKIRNEYHHPSRRREIDSLIQPDSEHP